MGAWGQVQNRLGSAREEASAPHGWHVVSPFGATPTSQLRPPFSTHKPAGGAPCRKRARRGRPPVIQAEPTLEKLLPPLTPAKLNWYSSPLQTGQAGMVWFNGGAACYSRWLMRNKRAMQSPASAAARPSTAFKQAESGMCTLCMHSTAQYSTTQHGAAATHTIAPCPSPAPCSSRMLSRLKAVLSVRVAGVSGHACRSVSAAEHVSKACLLGAAGEAAGGCWDGPEPPCQVRCKHPAESLRLAGMHALWDAGRQRGAQTDQPAVAGSCACHDCHIHTTARGSQPRVIRASRKPAQPSTPPETQPMPLPAHGCCIGS